MPFRDQIPTVMLNITTACILGITMVNFSVHCPAYRSNNWGTISC